MSISQIINLILTIIIITISCDSSDDPMPDEKVDEVNEDTVRVNKTITFDKWPNGTYSANRMVDDFGNVSKYSSTEESRSEVVDKSLKVTLLKNALSAAGGIIVDVALSHGSEYMLSYDIKFDPLFEWSRGGKIPGLGGGEAYTGGTPASAGDGWSFRVMWRYGSTTNSGIPYLIPYVYFVDQPGDFGHNFGSSARFDIKKDQWYTVSLRAKMNTASNNDGEIELKVDGVIVYQNLNFRWATQAAGREIDVLLWRFFRGGSSEDWKASVDSDIYVDNVTFERLNE